MNTELLQELHRRLGSKGFLTGRDAGPKYESDMSGSNPLPPVAVVRPGSTGEVSFVLAACHAASQPVVVQGGLTGLCGGGTPRQGEIALSLERLNGIEEIDPQSMTMTVLSGTPLERIQEAAATAGFRFPLDLGARGSCTIGGNISTNAGGNEVIRYGMARALVLGLEAVLPDGTVISSMNKMLKNNAGFDLKQLFIGTEGTLGVVTRAVLRLFPAPLTRGTAMCVAADFGHVIRLLQFLQERLGTGLSAFEVMWPDYVEFITRHVPTIRAPDRREGALLVLVETEGSQPDTDAARFESVLDDAMTSGAILDAIVAKSEKETEDFWRLRDGIGDVRTHILNAAHFDISVPVSSMSALVSGLHDALQGFPDMYRLTFGHLGDGNLHLVAGTGRAADQGAIFDTVYARVGAMRGSVSAEHGIGMVKRKYLHHSRSEAEIELMRRLKATLDPRGILNPGRVIP
ncbi:MAG TPA: FAD-binding oxidoreductase [Gammaproteobacteria bacterium]